MSRYKNSYLSYLLMYLFWYLSWALSAQFISVYLLGKGFSAAEVALVVSGASLATMAAQPLIGAMGDKYDVKRASYVLFDLTILGAVLFMLSDAFVAVLLAYGLLMALLNGANPVMERVATASPFEYGRIRIWGTVGYAAGTWLPHPSRRHRARDSRRGQRAAQLRGRVHRQVRQRPDRPLADAEVQRPRQAARDRRGEGRRDTSGVPEPQQAGDRGAAPLPLRLVRGRGLPHADGREDARAGGVAQEGHTARMGGADAPPQVQFPWRLSHEGGALAMPQRAPPPHGSWGLAMGAAAGRFARVRRVFG